MYYIQYILLNLLFVPNWYYVMYSAQTLPASLETMFIKLIIAGDGAVVIPGPITQSTIMCLLESESEGKIFSRNYLRDNSLFKWNQFRYLRIMVLSLYRSLYVYGNYGQTRTRMIVWCTAERTFFRFEKLGTMTFRGGYNGEKYHFR